MGHRLTLELPSMLFNPFAGEFAFFGITFPMFAVASIVLLWRRNSSARVAVGWWASLLLAAIFVPISLNPYVPAVVPHPRNLEPLVAPACLLIGIFAASGEPRRRFLHVGACVVTVGVGLYGCAVLHHDSRVRSSGAVAAYRYLRDRPGPCLADGRLAALFNYWDGFSVPCRARAYPPSMEGLGPGSYVVVDEFSLGHLPPEFSRELPFAGRAPPASWERVFENHTSWRRGLRGMLFGKPKKPPSGYWTVVYRVNPG